MIQCKCPSTKRDDFVLMVFVVALGIFGGVRLAEAACDPYAPPCPQGQFCCDACGCCVTDGAEAP